MSITISWQPDPSISSPTEYKVYRKANTGTPLESYAEEDFTLLDTIVGSPDPAAQYTDSGGVDGYWYRVQTCSGSDCAPLGFPISWKNVHAFCKLTAGTGFLSAGFSPGAVPAKVLYQAEAEATWWIVEQYLRPKYLASTIFEEMWHQPLPQVRQIAELHAAIQVWVQYKPDAKEQLEGLNDRLKKLSDAFYQHRLKLLPDITTQADDALNPAEITNMSMER